MLAIASLVFAFAQPYIPLAETARDFQAGNAVSIYVDNSFSMQAPSDAGSLLDEAKNRAAEIALAFNQSDEYNLITNDLDAAGNPFMTRQDFLDALEDVDFSPKVITVSGITRKQNEVFRNASMKNRNSFLISDFQESILDITDIRPDTTVDYFVLPLYAQKRNNVFIDTCWFSAPAIQIEQPATLTVLVKNGSETDLEKIPVKLIIDETQRALGSFDVNAFSETVVHLTFTLYSPGIKKGIVEISDYPVVYDNDLFFTFNVSPAISVFRILSDQSTPYLEMLFDNDSMFTYKSVSNQRIDYSDLQGYDLVVLDQVEKISSGLRRELERLLQNNINVAIIPPVNADIDSYNEFLDMAGNIKISGKDTFDLSVEWMNLEDPLFRDVFEELPQFSGNTKIDLPQVRSHYTLDVPARSSAEELMVLNNDDPFLIRLPYLRGDVYFLASPLDPEWTNFYEHAMFVPVFYKLSMLSNQINSTYYVIGRDDIIYPSFVMPGGDSPVHVINSSERLDYIPEFGSLQRQAYLKFHGVISVAGHYDVKSGHDDLGTLAFNYDRRESLLAFPDEEKLKKEFSRQGNNFFLIFDPSKPLGQTIRELGEGRKLWKLFIIFALVFLASEVVMLRLWK